MKHSAELFAIARKSLVVLLLVTTGCSHQGSILISVEDYERSLSLKPPTPPATTTVTPATPATPVAPPKLTKTETMATSHTVTLSWKAPTTGIDGKPAVDLQGYMLYVRTPPEWYRQGIDVGNRTNYTLEGLADGATFLFAVTAYDSNKRESAYSNEVSKSFSSESNLSR